MTTPGPRRYILIPLGSAGDVHPLTWLAKLLAARGHEVVMVAQTMVADIPRAAGVRVVPVGSAEEQLALVQNPDLWHPDHAFKLLAKKFPGWAREMIPAIRAEVVPGRTVLVAGGLAFAGRLVAEADRLPLITVQMQPSAFLSVADRPLMHQRLEWLRHLPDFAWRGFFALADWIVDADLAKPMNALRAELGLTTPVRGIMRDWWQSPDRVLALFPEWYAPARSDWPPQTVVTRFPLYDEAAERPPDPALEEFLAAGDPPILFSPGSANMWAKEFFAAGTEACRQLGRRALIVSRFAEHLPADVRRFEYVPFSRVFPRCAAVVHHGGVGTSAQGLAAGVPQLLFPMAHDQPDQAQRLKRLGVADYLYPQHFRPAAVARKLQHLLSSPSVAQSCRELQTRMRTQMPPEQVVAALESVRTTPSSVS